MASAHALRMVLVKIKDREPDITDNIEQTFISRVDYDERLLEWIRSNPIRDPQTWELTPIEDIPGLTANGAAELRNHGFPTVYSLIGQYMCFSYDKDLMKAMIEDYVSPNDVNVCINVFDLIIDTCSLSYYENDYEEIEANSRGRFITIKFIDLAELGSVENLGISESAIAAFQNMGFGMIYNLLGQYMIFGGVGDIDIMEFFIEDNITDNHLDIELCLNRLTALLRNV